MTSSTEHPEGISKTLFLRRLQDTTATQPRKEFHQMESITDIDPVTFLYDWATLCRLGIDPFYQPTKDSMTDSTQPKQASQVLGVASGRVSSTSQTGAKGPIGDVVLHKSDVPADEQILEAEIQAKGLTAPRLTPEHINSCIVSKTFHVFPDTLHTICQLRLKNGFTVTGENACASPANWDRDIGEAQSFLAARNKIWELEGYLLKQTIFDGGRKLEEVARACHEANRAYCKAMGDHSHKAWDECDEAQKRTIRLGVEFRLNHPDSGPGASHESWLNQKISEGWTYGPEKDSALRKHPCCLPFEELSVEQQAKDSIFTAIVKSMTRPS